MNKVIEKIVIADEQARKKVQLANSKKDEIKKLSENKKVEIQNKYMQLAKSQIEKAENEDLQKAKANLKNCEALYDKLSDKLDTLYKKNADEWITSICHNVINSFAGK